MKNEANAAESSVAVRPPAIPPIWELKKTAGKKKNQIYGRIAVQNNHCKPKATNGNQTARQYRNIPGQEGVRVAIVNPCRSGCPPYRQSTQPPPARRLPNHMAILSDSLIPYHHPGV